MVHSEALGASQFRDALFSDDCHWEKLSLKNRLDQDIELQIQCHLFKGRFHLLIRSANPVESRKLQKSAEHIARQLVDLIKVAPDNLSFVLVQENDPQSCWRWAFRWVGNSPLHSSTTELTDAAQQRLFSQVIQRGAQFPLIMRVGDVA
ncbi:MAG: hypothetical protein AseanaTS_16120 [Candidatus Pelagadaptatus aseana]|uniref:hypothetical protein n=1 Tax=Candidatus Pelagadaptatus aseana TaxID=3120508 RepID=UPI0039B17D91